MRKATTILTVEDSTGMRRTYTGRAAWALIALLDAADRGCTPINQPAPRWAHYVFVLRRDGLEIETITEHHGGRFPGHHARYVLRTQLRVIDRPTSAAA